MSKRIEILYNYIKANIPGWKHVEKVSDDIFYMHYNINALHTLDIIVDNVPENDEIVNHYYNYPKVKVYTYDTVIGPNDPFNGKKIYGDEFSGETYELFQKEMVRLHFEKLSLDELRTITYMVGHLYKE